MQSNRQFNIIGLGAILFILGISTALVIQLRGRTGSYIGQRQIVLGTELRGIQRAMTQFAENNNGYMPGMDSSGQLVTAPFNIGAAQPSNNGYDNPAHPAYRFRLIVERKLFHNGYIISAYETKKPWSGGPMTTLNYSYALLNLPSIGARRYVQHSNGKATQADAMTPIICDRAIALPDGGLRSVHTDQNWHGTVAWNDNHISYENDPIVDTQYANITNTNDNLFTATSNNDAAMAYGGVDDYVDGD